MSQTPRIFPACHPPRTRVTFQHPVIGLVHGVISSAYLGAERCISSHPDGLAYIVDVNFQDRGLVKFVKQPSDICVIH